MDAEHHRGNREQGGQHEEHVVVVFRGQIALKQAVLDMAAVAGDRDHQVGPAEAHDQRHDRTCGGREGLLHLAMAREFGVNAADPCFEVLLRHLAKRVVSHDPFLDPSTLQIVFSGEG